MLPFTASQNQKRKPRPMVRRSPILVLPLALWGAILTPTIAAADITLPDCATLAAWAGSTDFKVRHTLNPLTTLGSRMLSSAKR